MKEEWKAIDGTNGIYEVSNTGKIRSNNYLGHGTVRELKSHHDQKGYFRTRIFKGNRGTKLVAINLETGDKLYFGSQAEASETLHIPQANISQVILKKRKSAHGYTFCVDKRG